MQNLDDLLQQDIDQKICLLRGDYNCPLKDGVITDTTRIDKSMAGLKALRDAGARLVLCSHLGRPKGQAVPEYSLAPVAAYFAQLFGHEIPLLSIADADTLSEIDAPVVMLENLRFHAEEEKNEDRFAQQLASCADFYVNDAFSTAHRAHASTHAVARYLPAYAGALLRAEVDALVSALDAPVRPVAAVVGGAKISTKIDVLMHLVKKTDHIILGGGMANTFAAARGVQTGASLCEPDLFDTAQQIEQAAIEAGCSLHLPVDGIVATKFEAGAQSHVCTLADGLSAEQMMLDIGPESVRQFIQIIQHCKTVLWNGPMGAFELAGFERGTYELAQATGSACNMGALTAVAGGGDTVAALNGAGIASEFSYVSLAGGAFLEWIEGKTLPGIAALEGDF